MKPFILIGPMGSGKSTLGRRSAKQLGLKFMDTDKEFLAKFGNINNFFSSHGEAAFRENETQILRACLDSLAGGGILATGGGIVLSQQNRETIRAFPTIFLDTDAEQIVRRINNDRRPLLKDDPGAWQRIYLERLPLYQELATTTLNTAHRPITKSVSDLVKLIEKWDSNG